MADTKQEAMIQKFDQIRSAEAIDRKIELSTLSIGQELAFGLPEKATNPSDQNIPQSLDKLISASIRENKSKSYSCGKD